MSPEELAKLFADDAQIRFLVRRADRQEISASQRAAQEALYSGYDADTELHSFDTVAGERTCSTLLTNAGLGPGESVEWIAGAAAADAMPRYKPEPEPEPVEPDPEPAWAIVVKRRAYLGSVPVTIPPKPEEWSDPVPASWSMVYRSTTFQENAINSWDSQAKLRYCEGGSLQLCGSDYSNPDRDPYCRNSLIDWSFIPDENLKILGLAGKRCHFSFAKAASPGDASYDGYLPLGGLVIGCLAFSPDGVDGTPTAPPYTLPRVFYKVDNPDYPLGQAPDGEAYLSCSVAQGAEIDLGWELVEIIPFSDYVPPRLISPAFPGGVVEVPRYESQYWLVTSQGATLIQTVSDYYLEDEQLGFQMATEVWLGVEESGVVHVDFKIDEPDETGQLAVNLKHLQFRGAVSEVEQSQSWRRLFTNSTTDSPLPGDPGHPCITLYQENASANIAEKEKRLFRVPALTTAELKAGKTVEVKIWRLPAMAACNLKATPDEIKRITIPPFAESAIGASSLDQFHWSIAGFVVYV